MTLKLLIGRCSHAWSVIVSFKLLIVMFHCQGCCSYELLATLVEPPDVAAEGVLVSEGLEAVFARDQRVGLRLVHVADVAGERVPGQLLIAVRTRLLASAEKIMIEACIFQGLHLSN